MRASIRITGLAVTGLAATVAGAAQATTTPTEPRPEAPGELVDVDGHAMHLYCTGEGSPTVVLDAGLGDASVNLWPLQETISEFTRVCSYDRAGYGWSDPGPEPRTSEKIVDELRALLDAGGETGPFVLAGHSFGGLNMILFAATHPTDVAGVVLIDSSHPDQLSALTEVPEVLAAQDAEIAGLGELAAAIEAGQVGAADLVANAPALPADLHETWAALLAQPASLRTALAEYAGLEASSAQVSANGSLGDIPLVVLARGVGLEGQLPPDVLESMGLTADVLARFDEIWGQLQEDHLTRSSDSTLVVAENSPHYIYFEEPELVVDAIRDLVESTPSA